MAGIKYRLEIDGLRAVAVGGVVVFHAVPNLLPGGFAGVDVFFVISGYLIGSIIAQDVAAGRFSFMVFYQRRIRRLLPAMALVMLAIVSVGAILLVPTEFSTLTLTVRATVLYASNIVFAMRIGYFDQAGAASPLLHTWSLSIEEQFYLLCPLLLWSLHRFRPTATMPTLCVLALLSGAFSIFGTSIYPEKAFFLPHTRIWELLLGVILAYRSFLPATNEKQRNLIGWAGLAAILFAFLKHSGENTPYPGIYALVPCLGAALILEANRYGATPVGKMLSVRPLVYLGLVSYPLYLWHWPILVYMRMLGPEWSALLPSVAAMLAALLLADLTWRWVEKPYRRLPMSNWKRDYCLLAFVSIGFVGLSLVSEATKGLPQRFSPSIRAMFQTSDEWRDSQRLACMKAGSAAPLRDRQLPTHPCRIGNLDAPAEFVLWGDSHAAALQPGLDAALKSAGRGGIVITGGCLPISIGLRKVAADAEDCLTHNAHILREIGYANIGTLIIAQRWNALIAGVMPIERQFRRHSPQEQEKIGKELALSMRSLASAMAGGKTRLIVVNTVPEIDFNVPNAIGFRQNLGLKAPAGPAYAQVRARERPAVSAIEQGLSGLQVPFIDPLPYFCTSDCAVSDENGPLYFDNNHLTSAATRRTRAMFAASLADNAP